MIHFKKKRVLLVDDDENIVKPFSTILKGWGLVVFTAVNGKEALDNVNKKKIDLIILDVALPDISGLEICKVIKDNKNTKNIKILLVSAMGQGSVVDKGFLYGADGYIIKQLDVDRLKNKVAELLEIDI